MFHFGFAEIMQMRAPARIIFQIIRHAFRKQNVTGIAAIHDALRDINSRARDVRAVVHIRGLAHGTAMNSHSHFDFWICSQRRADLQRTLRGRFRVVAKDQRYPVTRRQLNNCSLRFGQTKLFRAARNFL